MSRGMDDLGLRDVREIADLWNAGASVLDIASRLNVKQSAVYRVKMFYRAYFDRRPNNGRSAALGDPDGFEIAKAAEFARSKWSEEVLYSRRLNVSGSWILGYGDEGVLPDGTICPMRS